ncbi:MAG: ribulose 1,5-bisphosphate carboxylase [Anaerolineae bacterium]|nr:ribulose 1,5-bisphosphate carboxylase [Anaerolineae bacterium]
MKRLYDPTIFIQSLDSIDRDKFIIATYYIEDAPESDFIDHFAQLQRLVLEGSTGDWMRVAEETDEVREALTGRLVGYYEVPAPKGTKRAVFQIAYPTAAWDRRPNFPMMMLGPAGNCFIFSTAFRLLDVSFPPSITKHFPGPKYGIEGVREMLGVKDRPLVLHIIKPKMGMTPEQTAEQCYRTAIGGVDIIKDDEMAGDVFNCSFEARLEAVNKALEKAERETGKKVLYFISVTDEVDRLAEKARWASRNGAGGLLLTYSAGFSALKMLAADPEVKVPILLHVSHMLGLLPSMSFIALAKMGRVAGADMILIPTMWSSYQVASLEEGLRTAFALQQDLHGLKRTWPLPGGGIHPGLVHLLVGDYGPDIVLMAGGGLLGHPQGYTAGAKAFRQAADAVMQNIPLENYAQDHPELRAALDQWGTFERPKTVWGYAGAAFQPKMARRV